MGLHVLVQLFLQGSGGTCAARRKSGKSGFTTISKTIAHFDLFSSNEQSVEANEQSVEANEQSVEANEQNLSRMHYST
jgi:outer membrane protein TolC